MIYHAAPVQGHTDAAYRHFHSEVYGNDCRYHTPFIRIEKGELRTKDEKDLDSPLNEGLDLTPQVIFRNHEELSSLVSLISAKGATAIDINMGCPFPLQTSKGRGAATVADPHAAEAVERVVGDNPDITFSVKMRLGMSDPDEWKGLLPVLNRLDLAHVTLHPRVAKQQYGGEVDLERFAEFLAKSRNPVVYNGDLKTPADIACVVDKFPGVAGIMTGRGLLGRPSLIREYTSGEEWDISKRTETMLRFHRLLLSHYESVLCGDHQLISKISPFWEYAEDEIGRKAWKSIRKASNMAKYHSAVAMIGQ